MMKSKNIFLALLTLLLIFSCKNFTINSLGDDVAVIDTLPQTASTNLGEFAFFTVSDQIYSDKIELSWDPVVNTQYYTISRAKYVDDPRKARFFAIAQLTTNLNAPRYIDSYKGENFDGSITRGQRYYYRVQASRVGEQKRANSAIKQGELFNIVTGVSASKGSINPLPTETALGLEPVATTKIRLTWDTLASAVSYKIYASEVEGFFLPVVAQVNAIAGQQYYDYPVANEKQGDFFYFAVKAVNIQGRTSDISAYDRGFARKEGSPSAPESVNVSKGTLTAEQATALGAAGLSYNSPKNIFISWEQAKGATKYRVYRSTASNPNSTLIAEIDASALAYVDKSRQLTANVEYIYQLQAVGIVSGEEVGGPFSDITEESKGNLLSAPDTRNPKIFLATQTGDEFSVSFNKTRGAESYILHYHQIVDPENPIESPPETGQIEGNFSYEPDITKKETLVHNTGTDVFWYRFSVKNAYGSSDISGFFVASVDPPENLKVSKNKRLGAANGNGAYPIEITWDAPNLGASNVKLYRFDFNTSLESEIATLLPSVTQFIDNVSTAKIGSWYGYRIASINQLGQEGTSSNQVDGYVAVNNDIWLKEYVKATEYARQNKLTLWKLGYVGLGTGALGVESYSGDIRGTVYYNAQTAGLGGDAVIRFTNYLDFNDPISEQPWFELNGEFRNLVNASKNGDMSKAVDVLGVYPGNVNYTGVKLVNADPAGGQMTVTQTGHPAVKMSYTYLTDF